MRTLLTAACLAAAACSSPAPAPGDASAPLAHAAREPVRVRDASDRERAAGEVDADRELEHELEHEHEHEPEREADGESPDEPGEAMLWRLLRWRDENGVFDPRDVDRARAERDANAAFHDAIDNAGIGRYGWVERGPNNIGGRTRSLVVNPTNASEMWAGSVGGGVWHSTNAGSSWQPLFDHLGNLAVCSLALVPGTPVTLYAGTGEGFYNSDGLVGKGIYESTDGGLTFTQLPSTASWQYTNRIAVSPSSATTLLAATRSPGGIQRSTNGGSTWSQVRSATACMQVLFDPNDGNKCVADVYESGVHRVVYSTNGGASWSNAATGLISQSGTSGRIELCYAASVADMVYASCGTGGGLIWRSTNGGVDWVQQTTGTGSGAAWYYNSLWVDPTDANFLVTGAYHLYKSTDGGVTLTRISNGYLNTSQPHPDQHALVADPGFNGSSNRRVYATNDGGVYVAADIRTASQSSGWSRREQSYRASQFYGAAGDGTSGRITGGTQDNGHLTLQVGSNTASLTFGGDGGFAAIDWQSANYIYGEYVYAQVHRSTNSGSSASYIDGGISEAGSSANFIAPLLLDPNDPRRLFVGAASLWLTTNARAGSVVWNAIKPAVGSNISAIAVANGNPDVVWIGHNDGRVYKTANGTAASPTWTAVDDNGPSNPLPNRYIQRIVIDRTDSNTVFVGLGGFAGDNLRKTGNGGTTWVDLTGTGATGLPSAPVNGIAQHPLLGDHLYVGTEVGIFASDDGGVTWSTSNDGPADVSVEEVVFLHGSTTLLAATHGRGLWTIEIREPVVAQLGPGCPGTNGVPVLTASPPRLGEDLTLTCSSLLPNQFGIFVLGFSSTIGLGLPLPLELSVLGMPNCYARCSLDLTVAQLNTGGTMQTVLSLPSATSALGSTFYAQVLAQDPGINAFGAVTSNGIAITVGN
ncbi:MAG TPA: hypothetical protein VFZ65_15185 [Planctomycetota bacterium]|nr:hypothetical protein [Planctomycetota bacterium]